MSGWRIERDIRTVLTATEQEREQALAADDMATAKYLAGRISGLRTAHGIVQNINEEVQA